MALSLIRVVGLLLVLSVQVACAAGPTYYGVQYQLDNRRALDGEQQAPPATAAEVVQSATTVAFFPPDACRETKAAGPGSTEVSNVLRLQCGVLMSEIEAEAARAGFSVVSWQTLRGGTGRPIDYARENNVDLVFEINELSLDIPPQDLYAFTDIRFFQKPHSPYDPPAPLVLRDVQAAGQRCQQRFLKTLGASVAVSLDLKMVSVKDGRVHWVYRATRAEDPDQSKGLTRTYEVNSVGNDDNPVTTVGMVGLTLGGAFALVGGIFWLVAEPGDDLNKVGGLMAPIGALVALGSLPVVGLGALIGNQPSYPEPDAVICQDGWMALEDRPVAGPTAPPQSGSSVQFAEQASLRDPVEARRKALLQSVIRDFMGQLRAMKQPGPATRENTSG
ncbi:MAG: hypothetical protein ABIJ09_03145 [Pseudomonadota bacterium]